MSPTTPALAMRPLSVREAFRLRWKRRRLLWRSLRSRHQLKSVIDRTDKIAPDDTLAVSVIRNEIQRLPFFLSHYRRLGVKQFLVVDNASDDGTAELLADQPDVSLWQTNHSYRNARFGLDWLTWLQMKCAHGHWCLMVDADEILIFAHHDHRSLPELTRWLDDTGITAFGALILDMYPKGPIGDQTYESGRDPVEVLKWFDAGPFRAVRQEPMGNLWVQGGARERAFFSDQPDRSPTLNKLPLVKWNRRYCYVNSSHSLLPPYLNASYDGPGGSRPSGVLLHSKFLPEVVTKSEVEKNRQQHFDKPRDFDGYYNRIITSPDLWHDESQELPGWRELEAFGLMNSGGWV